MKKKIKVYYWDKKPNFGDYLSPEIIQFLTSKEVVWSPHQSSDIIGVGSLLDVVASGNNSRLLNNIYYKLHNKKYSKPKIWGTGLLSAKFTNVKFVKFLSVWGSITRTLLNLGDIPVGDPGLLAKNLINSTEKRDLIGVVPHHTTFNRNSFAEIYNSLSSLPRIKIIDPRCNNARHVVNEIAECCHIFSESLHGVIVSDSLGIPYNWIRDFKIHRAGEFKFYDYFASVRIAPPQRCKYADIIANHCAIMKEFSSTDIDLVSEIQYQITDVLLKSLEL